VQAARLGKAPNSPAIKAMMFFVRRNLCNACNAGSVWPDPCWHLLRDRNMSTLLFVVRKNIYRGYETFFLVLSV